MEKKNETNRNLLDISQKLDRIQVLMQILVDILTPEPQPKMVGLTGVQKDVYKLCDAHRSIKEISKSIGKSPNDVRTALTRLKRKGLVKPTAGKKSGIYVRTPIIWIRNVKQGKEIGIEGQDMKSV